MKLKSIVVATAAIIISASSVMAQKRAMDCTEMAKRRTESLKKAVTLDQEQEKKANEIFLKSCQESKTARENQDKETMKTNRQNTSKEIDAILTPEQQKQWKEAQEAAKAKRQGRK